MFIVIQQSFLPLPPHAAVVSFVHANRTANHYQTRQRISESHFFPSYRSVWVWYSVRSTEKKLLLMRRLHNHGLYIRASWQKHRTPHVQATPCSAHMRAFLWQSPCFAFDITQRTKLDSVTAQIALPALMTSLRKKKSMMLYLCRVGLHHLTGTHESTCVRVRERDRRGNGIM